MFEHLFCAREWFSFIDYALRKLKLSRMWQRGRKELH